MQIDGLTPNEISQRLNQEFPRHSIPFTINASSFPNNLASGSASIYVKDVGPFHGGSINECIAKFRQHLDKAQKKESKYVRDLQVFLTNPDITTNDMPIVFYDVNTNKTHVVQGFTLRLRRPHLDEAKLCLVLTGEPEPK